MKTINVKVIPNAKENKIIEGEEFRIYVKSPAVDGKANKELISLIADYFKAKKKDIKVIKGSKSRKKVVEIKT